ncbi:MAG TPA: carboxypeptidase-like regulatory domain-containing protein [Mucilaginibacter sp.]|jgi:hypothetical protein
MRFPWLILLYIFFPIVAIAQTGIITGTVTNGDSKKPLPRASVFLSNSAAGTATAENGTYTLSGLRPGEYTLVVSILGFEQYSKPVLVGRDPIKLDIEMAPKPLMLREVVISSSADWKKNYAAFREQFIGVDENAKNCVVTNPHILNLTYNPTKQLLHADADEFLVVENKALGYRVKFLLNDFQWDKISGIVSHAGQQVFEELPGTASQKKKWHENREAVYYGSAMHFYRSLYTDKLTEEGFQIFKLSRFINPQRPSDDVISKKFQFFRERRNVDSQKYYIELEKMSKYYNESLIKPAYMPFEIVSPSGQPGIYTVHFPNFLYIIYTRKREEQDYKDIYRELNMPNYQTSVVTIQKPYAAYHIDMNGIVIDGSPLYEGSWSKSRLSDLLPVDYVPDVK